MLIYKLLTAIMSYFQKYQNLCINSKPSNHTTESLSNQISCTSEDKQVRQSRNSFLKTFKNSYLDQFTKQQDSPFFAFAAQNKQNFNLHQPKRDKSKTTFSQKKSTKDLENYKKLLIYDRKVSQQTFNPQINTNRVSEMVTNRQNQLQELIYTSIGQIEREMMSIGQNSQILKQNIMLRAGIEKMKLILKQKLKEALAKNKQELTYMLDQYSKMIKKLLEDKQRLTKQLQNCKSKLVSQEMLRKTMIQSYEDKIKLTIQQHETQITNAKLQLQQFLDVIRKYQEEASSQQAELDKLREKIVQLEMDNDKLLRQINSMKSKDSSKLQMEQSEFEVELSTFKETDFNASQSQQNNLGQARDNDEQLTEKYITARNKESDEWDFIQIERYVEKIQHLLDMLNKLQEENKELNQFMKSCICSKIKSKKMESELAQNMSLQNLKNTHEKMMIQAEIEFIRQEMGLREAIRKKDECIERLTLVIQGMRKSRYESVDQITQQAARAIKK